MDNSSTSTEAEIRSGCYECFLCTGSSSCFDSPEMEIRLVSDVAHTLEKPVAYAIAPAASAMGRIHNEGSWVRFLR